MKSKKLVYIKWDIIYFGKDRHCSYDTENKIVLIIEILDLIYDKVSISP